jgi:hypothetical protein
MTPDQVVALSWLVGVVGVVGFLSLLRTAFRTGALVWPKREEPLSRATDTPPPSVDPERPPA